MPNMPNPNAAGAQPFKGSISFAVAKDTFFVTTDTTLLEQVLRPGSATLEENAGFQSVVKEIPERVSGMTFVRPDESARLSTTSSRAASTRRPSSRSWAANARGPQAAAAPAVGKVIANEKLPDFSVFAKYLSLGGSYSLMDDDGFTMTGFTLKRQGP